MSVLKLNSTGADVQTLESILRRLDFYNGEIDHIFDKRTEKAVKAFQAEFRLKVDGIVGNNTWYHLRRVNPLTYFFLHCSATREGQKFTDKDILRWHTAPKSQGGRGWSRPGYSKVWGIDGEEWILHNYNEDEWVTGEEITNGARGFNKISRHSCYIGGCDKDGNPKDTRTEVQLELMKKEVEYMLQKYPDIIIVGHNQVAAKACPSFDVPKYLRLLGVDDKNIYKTV